MHLGYPPSWALSYPGGNGSAISYCNDLWTISTGFPTKYVASLRSWRDHWAKTWAGSPQDLLTKTCAESSKYLVGRTSLGWPQFFYKVLCKNTSGPLTKYFPGIPENFLTITGTISNKNFPSEFPPGTPRNFAERTCTKSCESFHGLGHLDQAPVGSLLEQKNPDNGIAHVIGEKRNLDVSPKFINSCKNLKKITLYVHPEPPNQTFCDLVPFEKKYGHVTTTKSEVKCRIPTPGSRIRKKTFKKK